MRQWTEQERRKQSELIRHWQPWQQSTGPKTVEGKEISKMNAHKHGLRSEDMLFLNKLIKLCG